MKDPTPLSEMLAAAPGGRGVASLAVIERAGAEPRACWVPESDREPAYLAYSITKTFTAALILQLCDGTRMSLDDPLVRWFPRLSHVDRILDAPLRGGLLPQDALAQMLDLVTLPVDPSDTPSGDDADARRGRPGYGLGLMGDSASPWGLVVGHNGGGPCYNASAFHALDLGGASVCAMGAIEEGFNAERLVFDVFDRLAA